MRRYPVDRTVLGALTKNGVQRHEYRGKHISGGRCSGFSVLALASRNIAMHSPLKAIMSPPEPFRAHTMTSRSSTPDTPRLKLLLPRIRTTPPPLMPTPSLSHKRQAKVVTRRPASRDQLHRQLDRILHQLNDIPVESSTKNTTSPHYPILRPLSPSSPRALGPQSVGGTFISITLAHTASTFRPPTTYTTVPVNLLIFIRRNLSTGIVLTLFFAKPINLPTQRIQRCTLWSNIRDITWYTILRIQPHRPHQNPR